MKHFKGAAKRALSIALTMLMLVSMLSIFASAAPAGLENYLKIDEVRYSEGIEKVEWKFVSTKTYDPTIDPTGSWDWYVEVDITPKAGYDNFGMIATWDESSANWAGDNKGVITQMQKVDSDTFRFVPQWLYLTASGSLASGVKHQIYVSTNTGFSTAGVEARFLVDGDLHWFDFTTVGKVPEMPANPIKAGYTFTGWRAASTNQFYPAGTDVDAITAGEEYYAEFTANKYALTYYRGPEGDASDYKTILTVGGTDIEMHDNLQGKIIYSGNVYGATVALGAVALPGYEFLGWQDATGTIYPAGALYTIKGDETLTALWSEKTSKDCLVIFESEGAIYDAFLAYEGQTVAIPAADPTKPGAVFKGWNYGGTVYTQSNGSFDAEGDADREMVFTAVWEAETYSVSYDGVTEADDLVYGDYTIAAAPAKDGYTFIAWKDASGVYYYAKTQITLDRDLELAAVWVENEADEYVVKFYAENGDLYDLYIVKNGDAVTAPVYGAGLPNATYQWTDGNVSYNENGTITVTGDAEYTAKQISIAIPKYPVFINIVDNVVSQVTGFVSGTEFAAGEVVAIGLNIPDGYTLKSVNATGGNSHATTVTIEDSLIHASSHDYIYYLTMPEAQANVYVELEEIPAGKTVVKFVTDGQVYDSITVTKGENATAPATAPIKVGSEFVEWKNGTNVVATGATFAVAADAEDVLIYEAIWDKDEYTVSFDEVGGTPDSADVQKYYGDAITLPAEPAKDGYTFLGWKEASTGFVYGANATYTVTGAAQFSAVWEKIPANVWVVKFVDDAGVIYGYETVEEGNTVTAPGGPVIPGKTFKHWLSGGVEVNAGNPTFAITENTVFVAQFDVSTYNISTSESNATIAVAPTAAIPVGTQVDFTAFAETGYEMGSVILSYTDELGAATKVLDLSETGDYSFIMPNSDVIITAIAVQNEFAIYTTEATGTDILAGGKRTAGDLVEFGVDIIDDDYVLTNVYVLDGAGNPITLIKNGDLYLFTMPYSEVTIITESAKAAYSVTYVDYDNTLLGIEAVNAGELIANAPAPVLDGYTFTGWELLPDGTAFDPATVEITGDTVLRAVYEGVAKTVVAGLSENLHTFQASCTVSSGNENSSDLLQTGLNAEAGKTVYFKVAAKYDYVVTDVAVVSAEGTNLVVEPTLREKEVVDEIVYYTYAFTMPAEDVEIDVYTAPKTYVVNVEENIPTGGAYTVNGFYTNNLLVALGEQVSIAIEPATGYVVKNVTATYYNNEGNISIIDGTLIDNVYTFDMVARDVLVEIEYEANAYGIDVQTSNAESYKPDTSKNPAEVIESMDDALTTKGKITINGVDDVDYTNAASQIYKIPNNGTANVGEEVSFKVETFTGYELAEVSVTYDSGKKTCMLTKLGDSYYFTMPADDVIITAIYDEVTSIVTKAPDAEAHGEVTINGLIENRITADYKETVTVDVIPEEGWYVESITYTLADGTVKDFSEAANYAGTQLVDVDDTAHELEFIMPASDVTVNVTYAQVDFSIAIVKDDVTTVTVDTPKHMDDQVVFTTDVEHGYLIEKVYVVNEETGDRVAIFTDTVSKDAVYGAEYRFKMPASKVTIHVTAIKDIFDVTYTDAGGYVGAEEIEYKDPANVSDYTDNVVNAKPGHHFVGWASEEIETPIKAPAFSNNNGDFIIIDKTFITAVYEKDEIDVLYKAVVNGKVNDKTEEHRIDTTVFGDEVSFTAVADTGYIIDQVKVTSTDAEGYNLDIRYTEKNGTYTFKIPATYKDDVHTVQAEDVIVEVTFKKDTFTLTESAASQDNGTVAINGKVTTQTSFTYEYDAAVTITATPAEGYYVKSVSVQGSTFHKEVTGTAPAGITGDPLTLSFNMPAEDLEYTVIYENIVYDITRVVKTDAMGKVVTKDTAVVGEVIDIAITPEYGYVVKDVYVIDSTGEHIALSKVSETAYSFVMPADDVTVTVEFIEDVYTVTYKDWNGNVLKVEEVDYLDTAKVNEKANELDNVKGGEHFLGWISDDVQTPVTTPSNNDADFVIVKDTTITAVYDLDEIEIRFAATENGKVNDKTEAHTYTDKVFGDEVTFTAVPDVGYVIDQVIVSTIDEGGDPLDVAYTVNGTTYTFTVPATYKADASAQAAAPVDVIVTFKKAAYTLLRAVTTEVTGTIAVNGKVSTETSFAYDYQDDVVITATPADGYYVAAIVAESAGEKFEITGTKPANVVAGEALTLTFKMPAEDVTYTVDYEKIDYTITLDAIAEQGKIETLPAATTTVGELVNVTVTPEYGYHIANVSVTGKITGKHIALAKDSDGKYHFAMPAEDVVVKATFEKNVYTVKFIDWNGDILAIEEVDYLDAAPAPANPARVGYTFTGWDKDFSSITKNITVTAQYKIIVSEVTSASISFTGAEHGKVNLPGGKTAEFGSVVTIVADPDAGWRTNKISVLGANGKYVPVSFVKEEADYIETYSFVMPECAVSITVSFKEHAASRFTDCRTDDWYYDAVEFVTDRGYFVGVSETLFAPNTDMNRAMFVTVLARLNGVDLSKYTGTTPYKDVVKDSYYAPALEWATATGVINGYSATEFGPMDSITREQMCAMMYRYCKYMGSDMTIKNPAFMNRYTDVDQIDAWAKTSVEWAVSVGLIHGCSETTINPKDHATRAQVAQIIRNLCDKEIYE